MLPPFEYYYTLNNPFISYCTVYHEQTASRKRLILCMLPNSFTFQQQFNTPNQVISVCLRLTLQAPHLARQIKSYTSTDFTTNNTLKQTTQWSMTVLQTSPSYTCYTLVHTYVHTYVDTYVHTYMCTYMPSTDASQQLSRVLNQDIWTSNRIHIAGFAIHCYRMRCFSHIRGLCRLTKSYTAEAS